jgi:5-formaminoimidazole-4-carboxamide-1-beta-D-ribofuranosyl 5'-monophosphate synthetase
MNLISTPNNLLNSLEEFKSNSNESSLSKKVVIEKRKRHQAYITIEYLLGFLTYFDFFSNDIFSLDYI